MQIGLDKLFYAPIVPEDSETPAHYGTPVPLAGAITVGISIETHDVKQHADDGVFYEDRSFKSGTISLNVADIGLEAAQALVGAAKDSKNVLVYSDDTSGPEVAVGFRSRRADGTYRFIWLYSVVFGVPGDDHETKGETITYKTPTIEGTIGFKSFGAEGVDPEWKADYVGTGGLDDEIGADWFSEVYDPEYAA